MLENVTHETMTVTHINTIIQDLYGVQNNSCLTTKHEY